MQSWLGHKLISFVMGRTRAGDVRPTLLLDHPDVHLTFPDEVVVTGPPWRSTVCARGNDHLGAPDGRRVYDNRFGDSVPPTRMSWGRLREYEVYEDTDRPEALDRYLSEQRPELAA